MFYPTWPRARRALLYVPGSDRRKIQKAAQLAADCVCLDLEDGVALSHKELARAQVITALQQLDFGPSERLIRLNGLGSGWEEADLLATLPYRPDGYVIPKVESPAALRWVSDRLDAAEASAGWEPGSIRLLAIIETPRGVVNLKEIATASPRLDALLFGAMDFSASLGIRSSYAPALLYARSALVTHAIAHQLQAIDMVCEHVWNRWRLWQEVQNGVAMGFTGKQVIHPDHLTLTQRLFVPSPQAIAEARHIIDRFQASQQEGKGAFALNGKMIDMPVFKSAQQVLARAQNATQDPDQGERRWHWALRSSHS